MIFIILIEKYYQHMSLKINFLYFYIKGLQKFIFFILKANWRNWKIIQNDNS